MVDNPESEIVKRAEQTGSRAVESHVTWNPTSQRMRKIGKYIAVTEDLWANGVFQRNSSRRIDLVTHEGKVDPF
jgi:hypothetical protein